MKNSAKQILSFTMVLVLILSVMATLSGCYVIRSEKMKKIEGTYELTSYSGLSNFLETRELKLYVVIRADGTGYFAYADKNNAPRIKELRCSFESDPEASGKYSYVSIDFGNGGGGTKFGVQAAGMFEISTRLGFTTLQWNDVSNLSAGTHTVHTSFTRVSKATDLSYINEHFGTYEVLPYGTSVN